MEENTSFINSFIDSIRKNGELEDYLKYAIKEDYVEFEMIFGDIKDTTKMLNKEQFVRLKEHLSGSTHYHNLGNTDSLDIRTELKRRNISVPSSIRLTLDGLDDIKDYCKNDMIEGTRARITLINKIQVNNACFAK